ncbi:MAG: thiamine pyrophosphate-binding protein [Luteolibacter sp.]
MSSWQTAVDCVNAGLRAGVKEWVICGGARNAVLIEALAQAEAAGRVRLWRHFEERSAGFFALGRMMDSGRPCAVVTTSGTAAAELMPAMIEAFYQARPLLAVTADRPAIFRGSGAPQAILQDQIFGPYAFRPARCLDGWDLSAPAHWNIELDESFEPGPVQWETNVAEPTHESRNSLDVSALARWLREDVTAGLIVMLGGIEPEEREAVYHFCHDLAVPVVADPSSG